MRDIPIIFSAPMVRALLAGRKTQTRRIIKKPAALNALDVFGPSFLLKPGNVDLIRYAVGDRMWVRESAWFDRSPCLPEGAMRCFFEGGAVRISGQPDNLTAPGLPDTYTAEMLRLNSSLRLRPSIHMPRWASRLTLIVEGVKVERLQDITTAGAIAEGVIDDEWREWREDAGNIGMPEGSHIEDERDVFAKQWNTKSGAHAWDGPGSWEANPFVVAISFRVERANIDALKVAA